MDSDQDIQINTINHNISREESPTPQDENEQLLPAINGLEIDFTTQNHEIRSNSISRFFEQYYVTILGSTLLILMIVGLIGQFDNQNPLISNDIVVVGILTLVLLFVFSSKDNNNKWCKIFYQYCPAVFVCNILPTFLVLCGVVSPNITQIPDYTRNIILPSALLLLTMGTDINGIRKLGPKAIIMFFWGTLGIIFGGIITLIIFSFIGRQLVSGDRWKGMACLAGAWIGGLVNMLAMQEIFEASDKLYSEFLVLAIFGINFILGVILVLSKNTQKIDKMLQANSIEVDRLVDKLQHQQEVGKRPLEYIDIAVIMGIAFGGTGMCSWIASGIASFIEVHSPFLKNLSLTSTFFWTILLTTILGLVLSFTKVRKQIEAVGATNIGSYFLYFLIATIGLKLDLLALVKSPGLLIVGFVWLCIHGIILLIGGKLMKAPLFFIAIGSMANVGGPVAAPIVAASFHPSLAPVGFLLGILGYSVGTFGAWLLGLLLREIASGLNL